MKSLLSKKNSPAHAFGISRLAKPFCRAGALLFLACLLSACGKGGGGPPPNMAVPVDTVKVTTAPVEDRLASVGSVMPNEAVDLRAEIAGRVMAIHFQEGETVEAGKLLFELDAEKVAAQLAQVVAEVELARLNAERAERLAGTKAISKQEIDQLKSQVLLKEALIKFHEKQVKEAQVHAPFKGVVGHRSVSPGQFVHVGDLLATLTDDAKVKVSYQVPERHASQLKVGQQTTLHVAAYPDQVFAGEVDLIDPQVDMGTRAVSVRALAPNPGRRLKAGMFARVETITGVRPEAIVVPEQAVVPSLTGFAVYVVSNNTARLQPVELGMRLPGKVEVRKGLDVGQEIITGGLQKIIDGSSVQPVAGTNSLPSSGSSTNEPASKRAITNGTESSSPASGSK